MHTAYGAVCLSFIIDHCLGFKHNLFWLWKTDLIFYNLYKVCVFFTPTAIRLLSLHCVIQTPYIVLSSLEHKRSIIDIQSIYQYLSNLYINIYLIYISVCLYIYIYIYIIFFNYILLVFLNIFICLYFSFHFNFRLFIFLKYVYIVFYLFISLFILVLKS